MTYQPYSNSPVKPEQPVFPAPPPVNITRIELAEVRENLVFVRKYDEYWSAHSTALHQYNSEGRFEEMVTWLREHGWHVNQWTNLKTGWRRARAYWGEEMPVRDSEEIQKMRRSINAGKLKVEDPSRDLRYWY